MLAARGFRVREVVAVLGILLLSRVPNAGAIPAFARKYGMRCSACHEAWPLLNDFGRAFRDEGYQLQQGRDAPIALPPSYWPVSLRVSPHYQYVSVDNQDTDQGAKKIRSGNVADVDFDLLTAGTLIHDVSFLVVGTGGSEDSSFNLESAWVRFDNLLGTPLLNFKIGKHEIDLPRSAHRPLNLSDTGYLIYGYHPQGSASQFDMGENQRGVEIVSHDRGSFNRLAVSVFSVEGSPGSRNVFDTPAVYAHASHESQFDSAVVTAAKIGAFGTYSTWPTDTLTMDGAPVPGTGKGLASATKYGVEGHLWLGPEATPLHPILVFAHGSDSRELFADGKRSGAFNGGFLELDYTPILRAAFFGRADLIRKSQQTTSKTPEDLDDQTGYTGGVRYTRGLTTRIGLALQAEYSRVVETKVASNGKDVTANRVFLGADFAF
jgi:hypothetical protein